MSIPQYYGATGYLMVKHSDHLKVVDQLKAENEAMRIVLQEAADELRELKASVGFRGHTLTVIQRIDGALCWGDRT